MLIRGLGRNVYVPCLGTDEEIGVDSSRYVPLSAQALNLS